MDEGYLLTYEKNLLRLLVYIKYFALIYIKLHTHNR